MSDVTLTVPQWIARMDKRARETVPQLQKALETGAAKAIPILQRATQNAEPPNPEGIGEGGAFDTGNYQRRWQAIPIANGVRVTNTAPYSGIIEDGRRPDSRFPPLAVIARWAMRRLHLSAKEAKSAAFPIAQSIARRGLKARRVLGNASDEIKRAINDELQKVLEGAWL